MISRSARRNFVQGKRITLSDLTYDIINVMSSMYKLHRSIILWLFGFVSGDASSFALSFDVIKASGVVFSSPSGSSISTVTAAVSTAAIPAAIANSAVPTTASAPASKRDKVRLYSFSAIGMKPNTSTKV